MKHFYNTINLQGSDLAQSEKKAKSQNEMILNFFEKHPNQEFSPPEIQEALSLYKTPLTSIRRSITTLTDSEKLIKTKNQVKGIYDKPNYRWKLNFKSTLF